MISILIITNKPLYFRLIILHKDFYLTLCILFKITFVSLRKLLKTSKNNVMQSNFKVKGMLFTLSAKLKTTGVRFPNSQKEDKGLHNHYRIMVKTALGKAIFDFYGSHQDYINGVKEMKEQDLKHALYCFVSDACSAQNGFEDFCNEFGYNEDSRAAERIYKQCKIMLAKYTRICDADIYEVLNEINE